MDWRDDLKLFAGCLAFLHPHEAVQISSRGVLVGFVGKIHPTLLARYDLKIPLTYLEIDTTAALQAIETTPPKVRVPSPYPTITRDLSLVVDGQLPYAEIAREVASEAVPWLARFFLYDIFEGGTIPQGKKSFTFSLLYESPDRTLTDEEVNKVHFALVDRLQKKLGASLR